MVRPGISPEATGSGGRGAGRNTSHAFHLAGGRLSADRRCEPAASVQRHADADEHRSHFSGGLALDRDRKVLYSLDVDGGRISALDLTGRKELKSAAAGTRPYDVALSRNGEQLFVSDWAGRAVLVLDPGDLRTVGRIAVGEHPNQIAVHPEGRSDLRRLRSSNCVSVIDTRRGIVTETISYGALPAGPRGEHARRAGDRAGRQDAVRRQRRQQRVAVIDIASAQPEPGQGIHPDRLVSDRRGGHARRQDSS